MIIPMNPDLIAKSWTGTPERGAGSFMAWWRACLEAGVYVPVEHVDARELRAGMYEFHPEKWPVAQQMLKDGTDAYTAAMTMQQARIAAEKAVKEASNVTCLWHREKMHDGRHIDDTICRRPTARRAGRPAGVAGKSADRTA